MEKCDICGKRIWIWQELFISMGRFTWCHKKCYDIYRVLKNFNMSKVEQDIKRICTAMVRI